MAAGSNPYNIDFTLVLFNVWFAFVILFRESFDSPYPQSSCLDWMVLRISIAMVPWFRSPRSFPTPIAIDPPTLLFVYSPCHAFNYFLLLVWHVTWFGLYSILNMFPFFSDCHFVLRTIYLPSLFQALITCKDIMSFEEETSQVNAFGVQVMLAPCTTYFHNLWTLWGLWALDNIGFELDILKNQEGGGCMVAPPFLGTIFTPKNISLLFNRQSLDTWTSHDFSRLAHKRKTYYCQPPRMDQPITSFKTKFVPFIETHWILKHRLINRKWSLFLAYT